MHRPRNALWGVVAAVVAAIAFSGSAVAGNEHGNSGNAPGQQKKQAAQQSAQTSHGNSANAPGHKKQKHSQKTASSGATVSSHGKAKGHVKANAHSHSSVQTQSSAPTKHSPSTAGQKVLVCHRTGSATNPFVVISISINGWNNGHSKHAGDILLGPSTPGPHSHDASRCPTGGTTSTTTTTTPSTTSTTTQSTTSTTTGSTTTTSSTSSTTTSTSTTSTSTSTTTTGSTTTGSSTTSTSTAAGAVLGAQTGKPSGSSGVLGAIARTATRGSLPFTGLPVWVPALIGLVLIGLGLALRRHGRTTGF
jgi:hypothetical protein